jgi:hypothetical protein
LDLVPFEVGDWEFPNATKIQARFTEGFDTLDLKEAKALLEELAA